MRNGVLQRIPNETVFAIIGDFGKDSQDELDVANLVKSWAPSFVITTGDNNYSGVPSGADGTIGKYYREFIHPYIGSEPLYYGEVDATQRRFFPTFGNHDLDGDTGNYQIAYFTLPEGRRYYDFIWAGVHFFILDSGLNTAGTLVEPDGNDSASVQAAWFDAQAAASTCNVKLVFFHHPAYTSGADHAPTLALRWPQFAVRGVKAAFSGHSHTYERMLVGNMYYIVNGIGGNNVRTFGAPIPESQVRYNGDFGAMKCTIVNGGVTFQLYSRARVLIDTWSV